MSEKKLSDVILACTTRERFWLADLFEQLACTLPLLYADTEPKFNVSGTVLKEEYVKKIQNCEKMLEKFIEKKVGEK